MAIAVVLVLLVIGSLIFHFASPWWFTPIASNWTTMDDTVVLTFWVTGVVFVAVNLFLAWVVWKYRHKQGPEGGLRPGEQEARVVAHDRHVDRRRGDAGARDSSSGASSSTCPRTRPSSRRSASSGTGRSASPARTARSATATRRSSRRTIPSASIPRIPRAATTCSSRAPSCACPWTSRSRCCCARRTCCTTSPSRSSGSRWTSSPG